MIRGLPREPLALDLACGPGPAVPLLARTAGARVVAVDLHAPFLREMRGRARQEGLATHCLPVHADMEALPFRPGSFDLVWCEGGLYNAGFLRGLEICREVLKPGGHLAATEAVWLEPDPPEEVQQWWVREYPGLTDVQRCIEAVETAGLALVGHFTLPPGAWWAYYRPLEAKLAALRERWAEDPVALGIIAEHEIEIDMYRRFGHTYGYELFVCRRP